MLRREWILPSMVGVVVALALLASAARAQDLEPRAYANIPIGLNFLITGYGYTDGSVVTDPTLPIKDGHLHFHTAIVGFARSLDIWGRSGKFDVVLPYVWLAGSATVAGQPKSRVVDGFADPRLRFSVNLYGAPALSLQEFTDYQQDVIVGASVQVSAPLGQYDAHRLVNIGSNRWFIKPEIGISKAIGSFTLDLAPGVTIYTDNDHYVGQRLSQEPIYSVQGHVIYSVMRGVWLALDGTFYAGGRTTIGGVQGDTLQENTRVGGTIALPVNRYNSFKLFASTGASTRTGGNFNTIGIAWQLRWGAGL